jgi:RES domain-containing protein
VSAPLPALLGGTELVAWRIDASEYAQSWDSGEGAYRFGGRWNRPGTRAVYCALDASTSILEVAVHRGFRRMDTTKHTLSAIHIIDPKDVFVLPEKDVPEPAWLCTGLPSAEQQIFGDTLLDQHKFVVVPSVVSRNSWNLLFVPTRAANAYALRSQEEFLLDTRLAKPAS